MKYKVGTYLFCIKDYYMNDTYEKVFTKGRKYKIDSLEKSIMTGRLCYSMIDDFEPNHLMKESDIEGYFTVDRKIKLKRILNLNI